MTDRRTLWLGGIAAAAFVLLAGVLPATAQETPRERLLAMARELCWSGFEEPEKAAAAFGSLAGREERGSASQRYLLRIIAGDGEGNEARAELWGLSGAVLRVRAELSRQGPGGALRPSDLLELGRDCEVFGGRRITYDEEGRAEWLLLLDPSLKIAEQRLPLNPPIPEGEDPGGVAVAQVDSGVNYELSRIAGRLARDGEGRALGYDFWELDERPYDNDSARSAFFPQRHGTGVAAIFLREAPRARLIPYRYPRPDMARLGDLVERAAAAGARIVMLPLGSRHPEDWTAFEEAARRHLEILFVASAGNDGRDIDRLPVYPAALPLENLLVVTSSDDAGRLAQGSNWGGESVDLMAPGEGLETIDHEGRFGRASGSSYVVPRVAALAARLLDRNPEWTAPDLIAAIRAMTRPTLESEQGLLRWGLLADPTAGG